VAAVQEIEQGNARIAGVLVGAYDGEGFVLAFSE
jgi:hypothetical protein